MNQVQTYCLLNQYDLAIEEIGLILQAYLNYVNYQEASELSNHKLQNMELNVGFKTRLEQPIGNPGKSIPWLIKNWPEIEQYLMLRTLHKLETPEIINPHDKERTEEQEEETEWRNEDPFIIKP